MEELEYKVWFSKIEISNKNKLELLKRFETCKNIWNLDKNILKEEKYNDRIISKIFELDKKNNLEKEVNYLYKNNIKLLTIYDENFPEKLLNIFDCPSQIYLRGDIKKL